MTTHRVRDPNVIHFTIDGRHGILGAIHITEACTFHMSLNELPPGMFLLDVVLRSNIFPLQHMVHKNKLQRADVIPLLFPRLLCHTLEHLGYSSEPQLECRRICREIFTLDKWNHMTTYVAPPRAPTRPAHPEIPQDEQPQQIHQNLGILSPLEHDMLGPSEPTDPSQEAPPVEQTVPHEETTTIEVETLIQSTQTTTTEPSSPHDPPTTT
ncbi:hypothetical protein CK203_062068 [Vitis vinifera]|uniref:Uncharacterized protein n=1 Tax=Vitis vinifera TaxID=29760 RepID=A0A438GC02_VITVI|nr:hypothetical protein CK203_062068 [Vitis vinifera]